MQASSAGKYPFPDKSMQKEWRGPIGGGAVRLIPFDPRQELCIAEGVETAASCAQLFDLPAWAALSTAGLMALELPPAIRNVVICADNDRNGECPMSNRKYPGCDNTT
jgi:putative DNA primase/helicase